MLLSQTKVAQILGISVGTLAHWRVRGFGLPFVKVGHFVRYKPQDVEEFIASNSRRSTKEEKLDR